MAQLPDDTTAFDAVFDAHYERLCVFAAHIVGSDAVAEEVVQDTFLQIWRRRERFDAPGAIVGYLYRAVRNRAIGHLRHQRVERRWRDGIVAKDAPPAPGVSAHPATPDEELQGTELAVAIERAVAALPPRCREAFLLRRQAGLSYAEIAETMGISIKTVEVQIGAALRSLRAALQDWIP